MPDKQFHIAYKNSSRWVQQGVTYDARYNTRPFDQQTDENNYYQPRQTNDVEYIQVLSDWFPTLKYYTCDGVLVNEFEFVGKPINIVDQTFSCYEATVQWSLFAPNRNYIGVIEYTNDDLEVIQWACTPIDLQVSHPYSILFQYTNSKNDEDGIIWSTDIEMNIRVDALLGKFQPKSERSEYNDQYFDGELLDGISYRQQILKLLDINKIGLPNWIIDKMNRIFTECDDTRLDGESYIAVSGEEFKLTRPEAGQNEDAFAEITVQQVPNPNFGRLETGDIPDDTPYIIMPAPLEFTNKGAPFSFANTFVDKTELLRIVIYNNGLNAFTMKLGTSSGGNEIGEFAVSDSPQTTVLVDHAFTAPGTLYITIPNGVNISGYVVWNKLNLPPVNLNPTVPSRYAKGDIYFYSDLENYDTQFDNAGVGIPGSDHEGCVVIGTNGKFDDLGDLDNLTLLHADPEQMGQLSNDGTIELLRAYLPASGVNLFSDGTPNPTPNDIPNSTQPAIYAATGGGPLEYQIRRGVNTPVIGVSGNLGDGAPMPIIPKGIKGVYFIYLG